MKKLFYYKIEPFMGSIPDDKVRVQNISFESGFFNEIVGEHLQYTWTKIRYTYKDDNKDVFDAIIAEINKNIIVFMKDKQVLDDKQKQFYLNFNRDGIDCFVSRWNWKDNN